MSKIFELSPEYHKNISSEIESGVLYISNEFEVAIHLCACGCGGKTVTPLGKDGWTITKKEGKVTLRPSIGNWKGESPYHAHYYITDNKIQWL